MSFKLKKFLTLLIIFLSIQVTQISATSVIRLSFSDLVKRAHRILYVKFEDMKTDGNSNIYTFTILQTIKGQSVKSITLKEFQNKSIEVIGSFHSNLSKNSSEAILFLTEDNIFGYPAIVGFSQGFIPVILTDDNKKVVNLNGNNREPLDDFIKRMQENL